MITRKSSSVGGGAVLKRGEQDTQKQTWGLSRAAMRTFCLSCLNGGYVNVSCGRGGKKRSHQVSQRQQIKQRHQTVSPGMINWGNRWQNIGQHPWHSHNVCKIHSSGKTSSKQVSGWGEVVREKPVRCKMVLVLKGYEGLGVESWGGIWLRAKSLRPGWDAQQRPGGAKRLCSLKQMPSCCKSCIQP